MKKAESLATSIISFLKENGQYDLLPEISEILQKEAYRSRSITVISAVELSAPEKKDLETSLTAKWGEHPFVFTIDSLLVSGFIVRFQDQVIDMSGRGSLSQLKQSLI